MQLYKPVQSLFTKQILRVPQLGKNIHVSYCVLYRGTCIAICLLLWEKVCCRSVGKSLHTDTHTLYMLSWNINHRYQNYYYSNTVLEKINKIFSVPESFQVEYFQQIT